MTRKHTNGVPDLLCDPFHERPPLLLHRTWQLLGGRFEFESNSPRLLRVVDSAYAGVPQQTLSAVPPRLRVGLVLGSHEQPPRRREPPPLTMLSGAGLLGGATDSSSFVAISPRERAALVFMSPQMLRFPYHARYELLEFAVFTLAARVQGLVSLHAACVGCDGQGVLLMGPSGAGKSTLALLCLLQGFDFLSEDSVFVSPDTMLATGVANFLHVRSDSLRWIVRSREAARIRASAIIQRRSGVKKLEVDLRGGKYRLAAAALKISTVVFLSTRSAGGRPLLAPLPKSELITRLTTSQAYAANQPRWTAFIRNVSRLGALELRRGRHPLEAVEALRALLVRSAP